MAVARVVSFEGVSRERIAEMEREMQEGGQPDDVPASEVVVLHDPDADESLVIFLFETEDDYRGRRGAERDAGLDTLAGEPR